MEWVKSIFISIWMINMMEMVEWWVEWVMILLLDDKKVRGCKTENYSNINWNIFGRQYGKKLPAIHTIAFWPWKIQINSLWWNFDVLYLQKTKNIIKSHNQVFAAIQMDLTRKIQCHRGMWLNITKSSSESHSILLIQVLSNVFLCWK